jgi:hypothetical protein
MNIDHLGDPATISQPDIRFAKQALDAARNDREQAKKTLVQLVDYDLDAAKAKDAIADEASRSAGKGPLKGRPQTHKAEEAIAAAQHEQRVCDLAVDRAERSATRALAKHHAAWAQEVTDELDLRTAEWALLCEGLTIAANKRSAAVRVAQTVLSDEVAGVGAVPFSLRQLAGIEIPAGGPKVASVDVGDILSGLADLGKQQAAPATPDGFIEGNQMVRSVGPTPGPNVGPLGPPEDTRAGSPKVQDFIARSKRERETAGATAA